MMVWTRGEKASGGRGGGAGSHIESEESDSELDDDCGYDSDVQREKETDYKAKTYANPIREMTGTKPHLQEKEPVADPRYGRRGP